MSTKRFGNKLVGDISRAILFLIKQTAGITLNEIVTLLEKQYSPKSVRNTIYSLKSRNSIDGDTRSGLEITERGIEALSALEFTTIKQHAPWDQKWRVVIYDIPEEKRIARDKIRYIFKELGFKQMQISVWVHPLPCLKQFQDIRKAYGIQKHLLLFETKHSKDFDSLLQQFKKSYPKLLI